MPVDSPCVRNCCLDKNDMCIGCGRTVEEITCWGGTGDEEKRQILAAIEKRQSGKEKV